MLRDESYHLNWVRNDPWPDPPTVMKAPYQRQRLSCHRRPRWRDWRLNPPPRMKNLRYLRTAALVSWHSGALFVVGNSLEESVE